jgi:ADP-heptose:LPS heptosyltransferase
MKFLIIRFSSIGDIVLTTPVVRCLRKQVPGAVIHYLTKKNFASVVANNPYIEKVHYLTDDFGSVIPPLEEEKFDHIIDLHHNIRTLKVKKALRVPAASFNKLNIQKWLLTTFRINIMPDQHIVDRYLDTVSNFNVSDDGGGLDYFIPEEDRVKETDIPAGHLAGYIAIAIGATYATKRLPVEKLQQLCMGIDHPIILLGGPEDRERAEVISSVDRHRVYNACGKFNLNESADLVRRSKFLITHDTGLMHIATALKKPVMSVWGNTVPEFGMYPYYGERFLNGFAQRTPGAPPYDIFEVRDLSCRPCSKIGYNKCPLRHFKCMNQIDIPAMIGKVNERLRR